MRGPPITESMLGVMTWVAWIAIALAVFAAYQLYQRWNPRERSDWNSAAGRTVYDHIREIELVNGQAETTVMDRERGQHNEMCGSKRHDDTGGQEFGPTIRIVTT